MALASGLATALLVLRVTGFRRRWPWRVGWLQSDIAARNGLVRRDRHGVSPGGRRWDRAKVVNAGRRRSPGSTTDIGRPTDTDILRSLSLTADLLVVAVGAGHSIHTAVEAVAEFGDGPVGVAFDRMWRRFRNGSPIVEELRNLPVVLGESVRPLSSTLTMTLGSGTPPEPVLQRLADRERRRLKLRIEGRIRRLPILLLGPLVLLILPSFVILSIVPVIVVTAQNTGW